MAKEPTVENRSEKRPVRGRDLSSWLVTLAWGLGAFIYGWLLAGALYERVYWNLTFEALGWADWVLALVCGLGARVVSYLVSSATKPADKEDRQLFRVIVAVLPALFLVSALAVLVLTLATYNGDWKEARQGIATAFAALIAAVGVVVSVSVSYKSGEENRLVQEKNLATQLEHQQTIEKEKGEREERKQDAELIKTLNDRLHEIIPRRYGDKPSEVSASYFQLAALYRDWETLAASSQLVAGQKDSQQRNILKILFGIYQESQQQESESQEGAAPTAAAQNPRSQADIRTLNSVIQDIFSCPTAGR